MPNEMGVIYDKPGFCALCHDKLAEFNGFKENQVPNITKWLPTRRFMNFLLDDNSSMRVVVCVSCYSNFTPADLQPMMESIIRGWEWEVTHVVKDWPKEKQAEYLKKYRKRYVVNLVDLSWSQDELKQAKKPRENHKLLGHADVNKELRQLGRLTV